MKLENSKQVQQIERLQQKCERLKD